MINRDDLELGLRGWRLWLGRHVGGIGEVLHGGLILATTALVLFLGLSPQAQEVMRALIEAESFLDLHALLAAAAAVLLSTILYTTYLSVAPYAGRESTYSPLARGAARIAPFAMASAPWLAAAISILGLRYQVSQSLETLSLLLAEPAAAKARETGEGVASMLRTLHERSLYYLLAAAALFAVTATFLHLARRMRSATLQRIWYWPALLLFLVFGVAAAVLDLPFAEVFVWMGPLASSMVAAMGLLSIGVLVVWLAHTLRMATYVLLVLIVGLYALGTELTRLLSTPTEAAGSGKSAPTFQSEVDAWMAAHAVASQGSRPPPVYIVSAEGGGMYAAIASSLFLTRLQQAEPRFRKSVFAISGVSGGSLGVALFDAVARSGDCGVFAAPQARTIADRLAAKAPEAEVRLREFLLHDHLAVIAGNIPADILRKIVSAVRYTIDRADAFTASLVAHCPFLGRRYADHWEKAEGPALVLNTTWMSNGHRVAYAPFTLKGSNVGDGTLWSFADMYGGGAPLLKGKPYAPSIADAVVTSARFPGALPPLSLARGSKRHNFGDGGYADASGVTTAIEMFQALPRTGITPRLLMITFDYEQADPATTDGTDFSETVGPIAAILGVRGNLSQIAITRAQSLEAAGDTEGSHVMRTSLDPEKFGLSLGLQVSRVSFEVLSLLVGRPEWCLDTSYRGSNPIVSNSCIARRVIESIRG